MLQTRRLVAGLIVGALLPAVVAAFNGGSLNVRRLTSEVEFIHGEVGHEPDLIAAYHFSAAELQPFLWPVRGPFEIPLTRGFPMEKAPPGGSQDHHHHRSVWFCHGDVIPEGSPIKPGSRKVQGVDFWSEGKGRIVCTSVGQARVGPEFAAVPTHNEWRMPDGTKLLDESRLITLHEFGDLQLFVFDIDLHASTVGITFGDTKEGAFALRVNDSISVSRGKGKITNAEGKTGEGACWGRPSAWCDYSGSIDGHPAGIAIFDDPTNRYPACWHVRSYGLMAANPFGRAQSGFPAMRKRTDLVKLAKGEHLHLRYGVLLHHGESDLAKLGEYFQHFCRLK